MTREDRVSHIAAMMRALKWQRGKSGPVLAVSWSMSPDSVKHISAEAWRRVRAEIMDPERAGPDIVRTISRVMSDSMADADLADGKERTDHRRVAIEAAKSYAAVLLSKPVDRHEVTVTAMSAEQLEARKQEILAQIKASVVPMLGGKDDE